MGLCPLLKKETIQKEPCDSTGYTHALTCPQKDNKGTRNKNTRNNCMKDTHTHTRERKSSDKQVWVRGFGWPMVVNSMAKLEGDR